VSATTHEPELRDRVPEIPAMQPGKIREAGARALGVRFVAGALTSVAAGLVTIAFGPHVGGILLGFPAILAASLTLIEEQENSIEAREDARGATLGGLALAAFAGTAALSLGALSGALGLLLASAAWAGCALLGYLLLWWR
jgi:hypothetical protein